MTVSADEPIFCSACLMRPASVTTTLPLAVIRMLSSEGEAMNALLMFLFYAFLLAVTFAVMYLFTGGGILFLVFVLLVVAVSVIVQLNRRDGITPPSSD